MRDGRGCASSPIRRLFFDFIRSTPLLLQVYFFVLPQVGIWLPAVAARILAQAVHYGCFVSEVYCSAFQGIAGGAVGPRTGAGLFPVRCIRPFIMPQLVPYLVPTLGNLLVSIFKETPLLAAIAVSAVMFVPMQHGADFFRYMEPITIAGLIFLTISIGTSLVIRLLVSAAQEWLVGSRDCA